MTGTAVHLQRILVLHDGALGDCVFAIHVATALRRQEGVGHVAMATRSPIARWASRHGIIDSARSLDDLAAHTLYAAAAEAPSATAEFIRSFDGILSFLGGPDAPANVKLSAVGRGKVWTVDPRCTTSTHITRQWLEQLRAQGLELDPSILGASTLSSSDRSLLRPRLAERLRSGDRSIVLVHPGSGGLAKCCPFDAALRLMDRLTGDGWSSAWMIGPDEVERFGPDYAHRWETVAPVLYEASVEAAADLVAGADAFIGCDAGMTHLAALAGVNTLALFGPTDPQVWGPLGPSVQLARLPDAAMMAPPDWVEEIARRVRR